MTTNNAKRDHVSRAHRDLTDCVTPERIDALLPAASEFERNIVRHIVRQNVLSGRVGGLMQTGRIGAGSDWLDTYAPLVLGCFRAERARWAALIAEAGRAELYAAVCVAARMQLAAVRMQFAAAECDADDLAHEAFVILIGEYRLREFSFDEPLTSWIHRGVRLAARRLYGATNANANFDLHDDDALHLPCQLVIPVEPGLNPDWLSVLYAARKLRPADRDLFEQLRAGATVEQIAAATGKAVKSVYARRDALYKRLRLMLANTPLRAA